MLKNLRTFLFTRKNLLSLSDLFCGSNIYLRIMTPGHRRGWLGGVFYDARQIDGAALIDEEVWRSDYNGDWL